MLGRLHAVFLDHVDVTLEADETQLFSRSVPIEQEPEFNISTHHDTTYDTSLVSHTYGDTRLTFPADYYMLVHHHR